MTRREILRRRFQCWFFGHIQYLYLDGSAACSHCYRRLT